VERAVHLYKSCSAVKCVGLGPSWQRVRAHPRAERTGDGRADTRRPDGGPAVIGRSRGDDAARRTSRRAGRWRRAHLRHFAVFVRPAPSAAPVSLGDVVGVPATREPAPRRPSGSRPQADGLPPRQVDPQPCFGCPGGRGRARTRAHGPNDNVSDAHLPKPGPSSTCSTMAASPWQQATRGSLVQGSPWGSALPTAPPSRQRPRYCIAVFRCTPQCYGPRWHAPIYRAANRRKSQDAPVHPVSQELEAAPSAA
jgi:hypothetical protein